MPHIRYLVPADNGEAVSMEVVRPQSYTAFMITLGRDHVRLTDGVLLDARQLRMLGYAALELANELEKTE